MAIRPITDTLRMIDSGAFVDIASEKLNQLIKRVDDTGKSGKLTITLDIKPARAGAMNIVPNVLAKLPEAKADPTLLWITPEFNFSTENPNQQKLDLRQVDTTPTEMREAATGAGPLRSAS
jgi:hypothetical protein